MPTLAAKNSQAAIANMATAVTTTTTPQTTATAINSGGSEQCDADVSAARIATPTDTQNTGAALNHHYHHPPAPHGGSHAVGNALSPMIATATTTTAVSAAGAATGSVAASLATFNGNSNLNVANGNIGGNNNHNNSHNHNHSHSTHAGVVGKKPLTNMHTSREDVASPQPQTHLPPPPLTQLGNAMPPTSASIINNQQLSATSSQSNHNHNNNNNSNINGGNGSNNNNSNGNGNGSANISSILKGSKENLLQNCYNGAPTSDNTVLDIDDPGDGLGPLPPKWETAYTERGELYFIDHNTGTSHWLDPRLSKFQKKSLEDCGDDELPYGWEKIEDSLYGTYYIDHVNRRTQYENPVLEAKRRAAEQRQKQQQQPPPPAHSSTQNTQGMGYIPHQQPPPPPPTNQQSQQQQQQQQRPQTPSTQITTNLVNGAGIGSNIIGADDGDRVTPALGNNMVDISQRGMQPPPTGAGMQSAPTALLAYKFTRNPGEMQGERITASLVKSARGLGITIVGGDDGAEEFLQIKSIVPHGPAWLDGQLQTGDVLVYVNETCVLGFTHHEMVNIFQSILPGETVTLEVCRGYPLPFDPNDPNTEVVTTIAVDGVSVAATDKQRRMLLDLHMDGNYNFLETIGGDGGGTKSHPHNQMRNQHSPVTGGLNDGFILMKKPELQVHTFTIVKGAMGFGFTIADSAYGQKVKKILDYNCCTQLQEGDVLLEINGIDVHQQSHLEVVQILKDCSKIEPTHVKIQRGGPTSNSTNASPAGGAYSANILSNPPPTSTSSGSNLGNVAKLRKNFTSSLFRSKTPTADLYSTQQKEILPIRPKTPLVDTRRTRAQTPNDELQHCVDVNDGNVDGRLSANKGQLVDAATHKSTNSLQEIEAISQDIPYLDPYPKLVTSLSERLAGATLLTENAGNGGVNAGNVDNMGSINIGTGHHHASGLSLPSSAADPMRYDHQEYVSAGMRTVGGNNIYGISPLPNSMNNFYAPQQLPTPPHLSFSASSSYSPSTSLGLTTTSATHHNILHHHPLQLPPPPQPPAPHMHTHPHGAQYSPASLHATTPLQAAHIQNERMQKRVNELLSDRRRVGFSTLDMPQPQKLSPAPYVNQQLLQQQQQQQTSQHSPAVSSVSQTPALPWLGASNYTNTMQSSPSGNLPFLQRNGGAIDAFDELTTEQYELSEVTLERQALGFGFRIVGGTEEGSQVTVGHIVPGGAADNDQRINTGDEILSIDGINVVNSSHHKVVSLMGEAALRGQVTMILRRRLRLTLQPHLLQPQQQQQQQLPLPPPPPLNMPMRNTYRYPYDVIVSRHESEGFGFVIISSSNQFYGSTIGKLIPGSPADRCGELKVGDRIIAVNRIDISGMSHGDVVNLIKESGLHVRLTIGCPKDALTTPTTTLGTQNSALLVNSAQVSPGQLSQNQLIYTPLTTQQQQHKPQISPNLLSNNQNGGNYFMEHPRTSAATTTYVQQPHTQSPLQQQQQQQLPPQLKIMTTYERTLCNNNGNNSNSEKLRSNGSCSSSSSFTRAEVISNSASSSNSSRNLLQFFAIVFVCVACYWNSAQCELVFDDISAVRDNKDLRSYTPLRNIFLNDFWGTPMRKEQSHKSYRPLTVLTFRFNYWLHELQPYGYHIVNMLLHIVVCLLWRRVCRLLLLHCAGAVGASTSALIQRCNMLRINTCSFLAALLFAVHPIHTEAVTGVVGRAELLSSIFYLCAFLAYAGAVNTPTTLLHRQQSSLHQQQQQQQSVKKQRTRWSVLCCTFGACLLASMLCKEQGITIAGICVAYELFVVQQLRPLELWLCVQRLFEDRTRILTPQHVAKSPTAAAVSASSTTGVYNRVSGIWHGTLLRRLGFLVCITFALLVGRVYVMGSQLPVFTRFDNPASAAATPTRQLTFSYLIYLNLWLMLFPCNLCCDWTMGTIPLIEGFSDARNLATIATFASLAAVTWHACTTRNLMHSRVLLMGLAWLALPFLPASNLFFHVGFVIAERILYMPSMGYCLLIAYGYMQMEEYLRVKGAIARRFLQLALGLLLLTHALKTFERNKDWRTEYTLFMSGVYVNGRNAKLFNNVGHALENEQRYAEALTYFQQAVRIQPDDIGAHINVGRTYNNLQQYEQAELAYRQAKALFPQVKPGESYQARVAPNHLNVFINLAQLIARNRTRLEEADLLYRQAISMRADYVQAYINRGDILMKLNRTAQAQEVYEKALLYDSENADIYYNLGVVFLEQGKSAQAHVYFNKAIELYPEHEQALLNSAILLQEHGGAEARELSRMRLFKVLDKDANNEKVYFNLGMLAMDESNFDEAEQFFKRAIHLRADFRSALFNLALLLADANRPLDAVPYLNQLIRHHPAHIKGLILLGDIYINHMKDLDAAEQCYRSILRFEPHNIQGLHNLCVVFVERKRLARAAACLRYAHHLAPHEDYILRHWQIVQQRLQKITKLPETSPERQIAYAEYEPDEFRVLSNKVASKTHTNMHEDNKQQKQHRR
ncbi:uncharacterized protein LOC105223869 [Bactrocera dorsalis]|uniref:dolichyl-phosphate-mannose--protein mannosyltransferase n=2 Tax=Bactrocera dorsalis TaxID=27457 RepID=A0ABM3JDY9_BACDO|nr:uncharacterized protein LOC105223869 [Bactrocera dorsalis]